MLSSKLEFENILLKSFEYAVENKDTENKRKGKELREER